MTGKFTTNAPDLSCFKGIQQNFTIYVKNDVDWYLKTTGNCSYVGLFHVFRFSKDSANGLGAWTVSQ